MNGREQLSAYIAENFPTRAEFANSADISEPHLSLYLQGKRELSVPTAKRVSETTKGAVSVKSLLPVELAELIGDAA